MNFRSVAAFVTVAFFAVAQASPIPAADPDAVAIMKTTTGGDIAAIVETPATPGEQNVEERGCRFFCI
ncbi:hypothetical protein D9756_011090 [Leucocoprinus leucothites]|uniref:Uncharacterized protein n=1 Tax=Leucocoprinus leucothites TaxID=201217 RepID=A0A8H5CPW4_9AGAR|nr:hypothetical protein D9756_011090 [Leucoagaricus leucothites]